MCMCVYSGVHSLEPGQTGFPVSSRSDLGTPGGVGRAGDIHPLFPIVGPRSVKSPGRRGAPPPTPLARQALNRQFTERLEEGQGAGAGPLHGDLHELVWKQHCFTGFAPERSSHRGESKSAGAKDLPKAVQRCLPGP